MLTKVLALAVLAASAVAQVNFSLNTPPAVTECQPTLLTWSGGKAPFILSAIPAAQISAPNLASIAEGVNEQQYSWTVNLPANTAITLKIVDATGATSYTSPITVLKGSSTSCLSGGGASSGAPAASSGAPAGTSAGSSAAPPASSAAPPASSAAPPASSAAPPASSAAPAASSGASAASGSASGSAKPAASSGASASGSAASPSASKGSSAARSVVVALPYVAAGVAAAYFL
ncbi:hypothetical protein Q8F55_001663 [Vanrija albida]|uniref:Ser-Thr-rich glycosyl-phosphatidyl-inositol-anchored membrane family-domain-containing protein n=1 Tax=Vanrija albida TaxID=181172 RepID=A0ABR3Q7S8_9TREE